MDDSKIRRVRLSVPVTDEIASQWMDAQLNISLSVRMLIWEAHSRYGARDVFDTELGEEAPAKTALKRRPSRRKTVAPSPASKEPDVEQTLAREIDALSDDPQADAAADVAADDEDDATDFAARGAADLLARMKGV